MLLRRPRPSDAGALAATMDGEFLRLNGWGPAQVEATLRVVRSRRAMRRLAWALIRERSTGTLIGSITAGEFDPELSACELGWWLGPEWRRQGFGTEAVELALMALHGAGIARVRIGTSPENTRVHRIATSVGAVRERSGPHRLPDGSVIESVWYTHVSP